MATVTRYFCLHLTSATSVLLSRYVCSYTLFFCKNVVFPAQAEYILIFLPILGGKYMCIIAAERAERA